MKTKKEILSHCTDYKSAKIVGRNTLKIEYNNGTTAIRLHDTDIVTFAGKNKIILNSGGWRTPTTKDRINTFAPVDISQNKGLWYLSGGQLFYDNCIVNDKGELISKPVKVNDKKITLLKKRIKKYCDLVTENNLPMPNGGDCWYCSLRTKEGKSLGELSRSDHLLNHLKENYLHGSILVNAMREAGYSDAGIGASYHIKCIDNFKRALRRYLQKRLISGIAVR